MIEEARKAHMNLTFLAGDIEDEDKIATVAVLDNCAEVPNFDDFDQQTDTDADNRPSEARDGGGGGSRTRVRKHVVVGLYMRVRF